MRIADNNTICALATPHGSGAIAVIRLSGPDAIDIAARLFRGRKPLGEYAANSIAFGNIVDFHLPENDPSAVVDEVLVSVFRAPHSYTGEDSVEISCHGSQYIIQRILELLVDAGARGAAPGEFTQRAFLNGKMDLAQAEAVSDLINSETAGAHRIALAQMKGGFSDELKEMRESLVQLVSLMELELDFSEEDVEFADRTQLRELLERVSTHIRHLRESFKLGNVIKNGVPVAIVGATNTGKSTLLNALVGEERAIVSDIHGTTRDTIEDTVNLGGITFRFIDTAGIRNTTETIEMIGIERTYHKMSQASIIILVLDAERPEYIREALSSFAAKFKETSSADSPEKDCRSVIILLNKSDRVDGNPVQEVAGASNAGGNGGDLRGMNEQYAVKNIAGNSENVHSNSVNANAASFEDKQADSTCMRHLVNTDGSGNAMASAGCGDCNPRVAQMLEEITTCASENGLSPIAILPVSAKKRQGIDALEKVLTDSQASMGLSSSGRSSTLVSNLRHYEALSAAQEHLSRVQASLDAHLSTDLLTQDIRAALYEIGSITGEISNDEILWWIFGRFCIGK